jgi:serine/threonine-protein kinase RsbW
MSGHAAIVELRLPSRLGVEKLAMNTAAGAAEWMGFPADRIEDLKTAVAEACLNAIEHGNGFDERRKVGMRLSIGGSSLAVEIRDRGRVPFPEVAAPDMERKLSGKEPPRHLGMFLIRELIDEVEFGTGARGNHVRLVIHLQRVQEKSV